MRRALGVVVIGVIAACATAAPSSTEPPPSTTATVGVLEPSTTVTAPYPSTSSIVSTTATTTTTTTLPPLQGLAAELVTDGLPQPTAIALRPDDDRLYVAGRTGTIDIVDPTGGGSTQRFLDLTEHVTSGGIEQGLLGLAFHPSDDERAFVYYVDRDGERTLAEVEPSGEQRILFSLPQPPDSVDIRHYGGNLAFGPGGYLYVALGDGADARGQGQNPDTPFGAILRLDIDGEPPYAIPPDNPFRDGGAPEVWVFGLRNPWRFSIDATGDAMYIADVGQETWEEIDVVSLDDGGGSNLGWPDMEGEACFLDRGCDPSSFTLPVLTYDHEQGCSVTGGHVYRGSAIPELDGHYFYGDWCGGWVRSFLLTDGAVTAEADWSEDLGPIGQVNAFGLDTDGELYIGTHGGELWKVVPLR